MHVCVQSFAFFYSALVDTNEKNNLGFEKELIRSIVALREEEEEENEREKNVDFLLSFSAA